MNQSINQRINQSIHQCIKQSINTSINQSINPSINPSINQSIKQSINQSSKQASNQSILVLSRGVRAAGCRRRRRKSGRARRQGAPLGCMEGNLPKNSLLRGSRLCRRPEALPVVDSFWTPFWLHFGSSITLGPSWASFGSS